MNHIYKIVFNKATGTFVAVAEYARAQGESSSTTIDGNKPIFAPTVFALTALTGAMLFSMPA